MVLYIKIFFLSISIPGKYCIRAYQRILLAYNMLQFGKSWLEREVQKYYQTNNIPGLSANEYVDTIVTMLKSGRSDNELQNEVSECSHNIVDMNKVSLSFYFTFQ
jgi:hypothetical protein